LRVLPRPHCRNIRSSLHVWACLEKTDTEIEDISYLVVLVFEVNG